MPTPDRLAEPTLPAFPTQADRGAQVYWLSCLPCHGDKGQGLTDEFRSAYPPEEQYCWERGCHGENPYESGFTLPQTIPAVIGAQTLAKFSNGAQLQSYIRAAMPFWKPGSLTDEEAWRVTAFVLRENRLWPGDAELNADNASQVKIQRSQPSPVPAQTDVPPRSVLLSFLVTAACVSVALLLVAFILFRSRKS